jgi:GntR family transcriptional regulator, transcriptional repressor for pyruvate dehydrogenase complex
MLIQSLKKQNLSDEVYDQISHNILTGVWKEGDKLPSEGELCRLFNVSRVSIRSAFSKLKGQHLIITKQGLGSFVSNPLSVRMTENAMPVIDITQKEYLDILDFRQAIEFKAIDLLMERADTEDIQDIRDALNQMIELRGDAVKYTEADFNFHLNIIKASKNKLFYNLMLNYKNILYRYFEEMNKHPNDDLTYSLNNHQAIFEAIKNKQSHQAKQIIMDSMEYNLSRFRSMFKQ